MSRVDIGPIVSRVEKPGRYVGGELNQVVKDDARVRIALCFPDVYEVAMSHTGLRILYHCVNEQAGYAAERAYAPWPDLEAVLRETGTPLWSLETHRPLHAFDVIGFSLQYELSYPSLLNVLDLGGVPVYRKDRNDGHPLVIAGGSGAFNPEPLADFVDAFLIGEGEDAIVELCAFIDEAKHLGLSRVERLERLRYVRGMYVPAFFDFEFQHGGPITAIKPKYDDYPYALHRQVVNLESAPFPRKPLVPNVAIVHDRVGVEVQRGCTKGCRFCQAGMIFRPTRQRDPDTVLKIVEESLAATGQDEVSFLSLSIGDYEPLQPLLRSFFNTYDAEQIGVSLPSLRTETLTEDVVKEIARGRKHSFTLAPEAGSDRMRRIINKGNTEANLMRAVDTAVNAGWTSLKYYFMIGLPYENQDDVDAIAHLGMRSRDQARALGKPLNVTVSVSSFVPKPHTPFQWEPQISEELIKAQQDHLRAMLKRGSCAFRYHNAGQTLVEGVLSRGDRRVGDVIHAAFRLGCRLDAWDDFFNLDTWLAAFAALEPHGLQWQWFHRRRPLDEILPWDAVDSGVDKKFLLKDLARAHKEGEVEDCAWGKCYACSACDFKTIEPLVYPKQALHVDERPPTPTRAAPSVRPSSYLRVKFEKTGIALYLSHLEMMGALLRTLRRAKLELAHTQGFHPKPKASFSPALPFGFASLAEFIDLELHGSHAPDAVLALLQPLAPNGVRFVAAHALTKDTRAVSHAIERMTFVARLPDANHREKALARWRGSEPLSVDRLRNGRGRHYDLRSEISELAALDERDLSITILQRIDGTLRPEEVARTLFDDVAVSWTKTQVAFGEPLPSPAEAFGQSVPAPRHEKRSKYHRDRPHRDGPHRNALSSKNPVGKSTASLANAPFKE